ncbi:Chitinase A, N-terminal domain [Clostridium cavendishii DSM 21758]|uniref:Chitinase A, N-terminal domain n=1 Tax=Clostridium cavendishii DSM 21758 TaxID=1121302 RepID=A0A1M6AEL6_9CLOT|nr:chitinase N-terminal domain-containing protein [Clostridium cavendishii]SHI34738.1 Chitinase A, N-terminal domain [Clostridium cavendishii DSM 21758]
MSKSARLIVKLVVATMIMTEVSPSVVQAMAQTKDNSKETSTIVSAVSNTTGAPAVSTLTKDAWNGETDYTISMSLWYGNNADSWRLYENGKLVWEEKLVNNSPNAQKAEKQFKNKLNGEYVYTAELINSFGKTMSQNSITHKVTKNENKIDIVLPDKAVGQPAVGYKVVDENEDTVQWAVYIANPNKSYIWGGNDFSSWGLSFNTSAQILEVANAASFKQDGNNVTINLKQDEQLIPLNTSRVFIVKAKKDGNSINPTNIKPNQFRGNVVYPEYAKLPSTWEKGKKDLKISDLVANENEYYNNDVKTNTGNKLITYNPSHPTQIVIGLPKKMPMKVNGYNDLRIWMPSKYLAMGIGTTEELFKLNHNFLVGLSIKENCTCALVPPAAGETANPVMVDGQQYYWPIQKKHPDGPFQQEAGNFNEVKKQYVDYLGDSATHDDFVTLKTGEVDDPSYTTAALSSGISITLTREFLNAIPKNKFDEFLKGAKDPWAEFVLVDNAYNRGVYGLLQRNLFTDNREKAINSTDINKDFNLSGFANHIENIENIITQMDNEKDNIYDAKLTREEVDNYLKELRKFYKKGTPTDTEWDAMVNDVHKAFDLLSKHWGDNTISYRYDFLTIVRVVKSYLPNPINPGPSGSTWVEQVNGGNR